MATAKAQASEAQLDEVRRRADAAWRRDISEAQRLEWARYCDTLRAKRRPGYGAQ